MQLQPVKKDSGNPFFGEDRPWDVAWWNTYPTIAYDKTDSKYKLWCAAMLALFPAGSFQLIGQQSIHVRYNGCGGCACKDAKTCTVVPPFAPTTPTNLSKNGMCPHLGYNYTAMKFDGSNLALTYYAESSDGVAWDKPDLGLVEFLGSKNNNIVLNTNSDPNRGVFLDVHETNASRRFKMFGEGLQYRSVLISPSASKVALLNCVWLRYRKLRGSRLAKDRHA